VTEGKDAETVAAFADDLRAHGGDPDAVAEVCIDMSPAFIKGTADSLPNAAITFDKFHAVKIINDAVDQVRRTERKDHKLVARHALPLVAQPGPLIRAPEGHL
jgi:transposase